VSIDENQLTVVFLYLGNESGKKKINFQYLWGWLNLLESGISWLFSA